MSKLYTYITLMLLVFCTTVNAQKLTVESFTLAQNDISALSKARQDLNGKNCALIKVGIALQNVKFEGNVMGDVERKTSEYWVYMPQGTSMLKLSHSDYLPLMINFFDYNIGKLQSGATYILNVQKPMGNSNEPADAGGNFLSLSVKPKDAGVVIDGNKLKMESSGEYMPFLTYGEHTYLLTAGGYADKSGTFTISQGDVTTINAVLESAMATLSVKAATSGAVIYVDKKQMGTGSWSGQLQDGMHLIEVKKDGYRSQQKTIQLAKQQKLDVSFDALAAITGNLSVSYKPIGSDIYLDGSKVGQSPKVINGVVVGNHKVEVKKDGYTSDTKTVSVAEGQTATLSGSLTRAVSTSTTSTTTNSSVSTTATAVDLGLSVKWATCNVGASKPEDYGDYYAWGETRTKTDYNWSTYFDTSDNGNTFKKYNTEGGKTVLSLEDDVAHVKWGGNWRMPTDAEQDELREKCTWVWTTENAVEGYKVTSKTNGNSIFLPAAGYRHNSDLCRAGSVGDYWCSSLDDYSNGARTVNFTFAGVYRYYGNRSYGKSVRPVCP